MRVAISDGEGGMRALEAIDAFCCCEIDFSLGGRLGWKKIS